MKQLISAFLLISTLSILSSCNTIEGAGQDIQKGGKKLEQEAKKNK